MGERGEALMRIPVAVVTGLILGVWQYLIIVLSLINWFYIIFTAKRLKEMAEMCEVWNTQYYNYLKYLTFVTNKRPFPFTKIAKSISKFE